LCTPAKVAIGEAMTGAGVLAVDDHERMIGPDMRNNDASPRRGIQRLPAYAPV
jgi:hypothetical protein